MFFFFHNLKDKAHFEGGNHDAVALESATITQELAEKIYTDMTRNTQSDELGIPNGDSSQVKVVGLGLNAPHSTWEKQAPGWTKSYDITHND